MKLSKLEQYQFSLTNSAATTPQAQRQAIARAGLTGLSRSEIRRIQLETFRQWRASDKGKPYRRFPAWFQWSIYGDGYYAGYLGEDWRQQIPSGIHVGRLASCEYLRRLAYNTADWGKLRKRNHGEPSTAPGIRTETNGKPGWRCVSWHYADYGCIASPDEKQIAYFIDGQWEIHALYRGTFFVKGNRVDLDKAAPRRARYPRIVARMLRNAGFLAKVVRQSSGGDESFETLHSGGDIYVVVARKNSPELGYYHISDYDCRDWNLPHVTDRMRSVFAKRKAALIEEKQNEKILANADKIWVTVTDSLTSGNCRPGTDAFVRQVESRFNATGLGAIRASTLLAIRDDQYVRRAVLAASNR